MDNNNIIARLDYIIKGLEQAVTNQRSIKTDTHFIKNYIQTGVTNKQSICNWTIKNMTDAQAKDLLAQGLTPQQVHKISNSKFSVEYLVDMQSKLR